MTGSVSATLVEPTDVISLLSLSVTNPQVESVATWCVSLSAIVRSRVPDIDARIAAGQLDITVVTTVFAVAIKRVLDYFSKNSELAGVTYPEYGATFKRDTKLGDFISVEEWELLGYRYQIEGGAYSVKFGATP